MDEGGKQNRFGQGEIYMIYILLLQFLILNQKLASCKVDLPLKRGAKVYTGKDKEKRAEETKVILKSKKMWEQLSF